ncbi:3-hydroxyacyl-CoA dehydrogenase/enoyl-CoA hydratase family protein [Halalkalibacter alkaliphilus]|uniref:3-hydroxyacyl-CoA dehydrogenase/enoyl-CoA hydratase family protein n=1 Tax=Halalkalibacter alkaliphilus TaxID=2917993 RepID=A0A9X2CVC8_9BACI|nr:3-hydroxyacyl-CoA dehydrogenase/enoyl-CoA hydratase family protein [Halalkalibacter alkaliphilus]MCL7749036.1 3-hydroxyacyl-CoA dehydrogenase/enoyl-CoA hydratase family protein [Halalkalibacter alkaliphilus]
MTRHIRKVAVIGSGVMGSGIAAHLANVGIPSLLLDVVPNEVTPQEEARGLTLEDKVVRNRFSTTAIQKLAKQKPAPLSSKAKASYIEAGNLEDDLPRLQEVDWIIEVIVENLTIKQQLLKKVDEARKPGTIVSSNTSGISIEAMSIGLSEDFQAHFLGTHFFNPPRYLKLLEIIPTEKTKDEVTTFMKAFAEEVLGKGVVECKDTPNFIANRIGTYGLLVTVNEMIKGGYSVGEVDSVTGPLLGRPKSASFRTLDVVGLDTFLHVAKNVYDVASGSEKSIFDPPPFMKDMAEKGWLGSKSGQGFYIKQGKEILELDPKTLQYDERKKLKAPSIERAKQAKKLPDKLKTLTYADDRAGRLIWNLLKPVLLYSADKAYEIAYDIYAVDQAMKWGFGWELGPFETWDAIGVAKSVERMEAEGDTVPAWVKEMLSSGQESFYQGGSYYHQGRFEAKPVNEKVVNLKSLKPDNIVFKNSGASLLDIGDDVALLEFHSPNNSIGADVIQMINKSIKEVEKNYKGLVINNQGKNFCVGANLMMILMEAQDDNFFEIDLVVRQFQQAMANIRYSEKPVVTAPFGMTLGGGTEICLPSASIQASLETYMGLVEVGVGLIPGGGGNKELYLRNLAKSDGKDLQSVANKTFETIAMAKVSTSAQEAVDHGFLGIKDGIVINGDFLIDRAKNEVLHLDKKGYRPPERAKIPVVGETGYATMLLGAKTMKFGGMISDHDLKIAEKLAFSLAGGRVAKGTLVDEQYLLDLEREAFLSLVAEPKSQQRMQYMLTKGKPLRN